MANVQQKSAYPYITEFKKEPFISFIFIKQKDIGNIYLSNYNELIKFYEFFKDNLLSASNLTLENIFWFLLLKKYLKNKKKIKKDAIFNFIKKCEIHQNERLGFKLSSNIQKIPDIYSTYLALACLKNLGFLEEYLSSENIKSDIKNFILSHEKKNAFKHCHNEQCAICKKISPARTLFFVLEIFTLIGIDVRLKRDQFMAFFNDNSKKGYGLIFKLLCQKYLDLDSEVKEKEVQYLYQFQNESGGFSLNHLGVINDTFWIVYVLNLYSWFLDYNPAGIFPFINNKLNEILMSQPNWNAFKLNDVSKLIILLSFIWKKFIDSVERTLFKQIEKDKYIDLIQLKTTFGLFNDVEDILSYINLNYNFKLRILDNKIEFNNFLRNLSQGRQEFIKEFYDQINKNSVVSLSALHKKYKTLNYEPLKLRENIFPIIKEMVRRNFFKGNIKAKKKFLSKTRFLFYLDYMLKKIIVCDSEINTERILDEKEKLTDIKNDIYNMTLKLKKIDLQIKEEIESYLLINEFDYSKQRLKFIIRDALMEADFLNENIENSFNEILYYINFQAVLKSEIAEWEQIYSILPKKLGEIEAYLKGKIQEKEELRNLSVVLDNLKEKIIILEEDLNKKFDIFRNIFREVLEKEYSDKNFNLIIKELEILTQKVRKYDSLIYKVSQQIKSKERKIVKKHKKVINNWIKVKEKFENEFNFYTDGFQFFNKKLNEIKDIKERVNTHISEIGENAKVKIDSNQFQEAFGFIKKESDLLLTEKINEIKDLHGIIKNEIKQNQKLFILYKHLHEKLNDLESYIIDLIAKQVQTLKNKVIEERNRTKIEVFDNLAKQEILKFKSKLTEIRNYFNQIDDLKIEIVIKECDSLNSDFEKASKLYLKKLSECQKEIEDFDEKSKLTIMQWEKFTIFFNNEILVLKEDFINNIIANKVSSMVIEKKTDCIDLLDLKKELKLSCKVLINKLKDIIDISKINAKLDEDDKSLLVFTDFYYSNKELRNYIDNNLLKLNRERIGKILALYDSSIRNRTLNTNMLELQNRIKDLQIFKEIIPKQFYDKLEELGIDKERKEFIDTKKYFDFTLENDELAIKSIKNNLDLFNNMQNYIEKKYNSLRVELKEFLNKFQKESERTDSFFEVEKKLKNRKEYFKEKLNQSKGVIEEEIKKLSNKTNESEKLIPEIREFFVKRKNTFLNEYNNKIENVNEQFELLRNESFREKLLVFINNKKIHLSQLLGNLERKVEDNIEIKEFKKINVIIQNRAKNIEMEIKEINRSAKDKIKEFNRQSKNFSQISKFILEDFDKFVNEYTEILNEKVKSLERLFLKAYIEMAIKAVANEYLTIGFLNNELKIKKQNIQDHLLYLISEGDLNGKYDPRFGIYYENPEVLSDLDEKELEVIKNTNFKVYMALNRLKNFTSQYYTIIAFFTSIITIAYYLFLLSGGNPAVLAFPIILTIFVVGYYLFKKRKEEKVK
ncbi:MAG: hypothetical protein ACFFB0_07050 [Promethearchaeota archaeon]